MIPVLHVVSCTFAWLFCEKKHKKIPNHVKTLHSFLHNHINCL